MENTKSETVTLTLSQELSDKAYTNIAIYARDTDLALADFLDTEIGSIYHVKEDIYVRNAFDGLREGMRIYVFSNRLTNASSKVSLSHPNVFTIEKGDYLKLMARTTFHDKSAVFFLHLPKEQWEEFYKDTGLIDTLLVNYGRREFEVQCEQKENPKTRDWLYVEKKDVKLEVVEQKKQEIEDNKNEGLV